ncbi:MAG: VanZ family protein [Proteobacteria bacterium]|nr:VanZ family protein [Pseudomonadota bacterium]
MPEAFRRGTVEWALLAYVVVVELLLTLSPFRFHWPAQSLPSLWSDAQDAPANLLLFLPVGYFLRLALRRSHRHPVAAAIAFGALLSLCIETLQLFLPDRLASLFDVLSNAAGAGAGALLCDAMRRRFERRLPAVLTLDHPLLNLVYLVVPLMWLTGVGVGAKPARLWLLLPLGAIGSVVICGLWRYRFAAAAAIPRPALALAILGWFLFGAVTGLAHDVLVVFNSGLVVVVLTLLLLYARDRNVPPNRRFEHKVLLGVWPCFALYLVMLVWWPLPAALLPFNYAIGYPELVFNRDATLRIAEQLGALTVFGYLLAESRGRSLQPVHRLRWENMLWGGLVALALEIGHGLQADDRASLWRWALGSLGAGFGITLYAAQLNLMQLLRGNGARSGD